MSDAVVLLPLVPVTAMVDLFLFSENHSRVADVILSPRATASRISGRWMLTPGDLTTMSAS
jgi:hypothetical protein